MRAVLATLERCQADLTEPSDDESRRLLAIVLLQLQARLHRIADTELSEFCATLTRDRGSPPGPAKPLRESKS